MCVVCNMAMLLMLMFVAALAVVVHLTMSLFVYALDDALSYKQSKYVHVNEQYIIDLLILVLCWCCLVVVVSMITLLLQHTLVTAPCGHCGGGR